MEWMQKVNDFERICTLKSLLYYRIYKSNWLTTDDLLDIKDIVENELEIIELKPIQKDNPNLTLDIWRNQVYGEFLKLQKELYNKE